MAIGVTVDFNANIARFFGQVDQISARLDRFQQQAETLSSRVNSAMGMLGVGISAAGITEFIKSGIDATDMLNDMSERTGIAIETLAGFDLVAKLGDTDLESFAASVNKLSINLSNNREEFAKLGITADDPIEAFYQLADAFSAIEDKQDKAALGAKVLGKSYAEMAVLLNQGGAALRAQVEENKKYSGITEDSAKQTGRLNDQLDILAARMQGIQALVGGKFATSINNWIDTLSGEGIDATIKKVIEIDADIKVQQGVIDRIKKHPVLAALENYDIGEEQRKLDILIEKRGLAVKRRSQDAATSAPDTNANPIQQTNALFTAAEQKYNLPPSLLKAVASVETGGTFKADLVSAKGASGIMQLMPDTAKALGVTDRNDKAQSIEGGAKLLRELLDRYNGNLNLAIAAYNAGPTAVDKVGGGIPNFPETQKYVPNVLQEMDRLQKNSGDNTLFGQLKLFNTKIASLQDAATIQRQSDINTRLKITEDAAGNEIETLKILKDKGEKGLSDDYAALTVQQQVIVTANIDAVNSRLAEIERQRSQAQYTAKPEDLPKINAQFAAQKAELDAELQSLQAKLDNIEPANIVDRDKEQKALDDVVSQVKAKLSELRNDGKDPVAIKLRLELENADIIKKLKQAGQSGLADQYINTLSATEQAGVIQANIGTVQQRTQAQETRINLLQQSGTITQFRAQQDLKQLYKESSAELDVMAEKLAALGDSSGLEELKIKALDVRNAAGQLRVALPDLGKQYIDAGQTAAINSMTDGLMNLTNGAESAGQAFTNMGLSVVEALQAIAAEQLAKQVIGTVVSFAGSAFSGTATGGGTNAGINTSNTGLSNSIGSFLSRAGGGLITGPGTETSDSINTTLPAGSFVIKAASVKKFGLPALEKLMQGSVDAGGNQIPVRLSNREFGVLPDKVKEYGRDFWQHINDIGTVPPAFIRRAYAGGGLVGSSSAAAASASPSSDTISVNVPVTVNPAADNQQAPGNKLSASQINEFGKQMKSVVQNEIMQQLRPGGLLYGSR